MTCDSALAADLKREIKTKLQANSVMRTNSGLLAIIKLKQEMIHVKGLKFTVY